MASAKTAGERKSVEVTSHRAAARSAMSRMWAYQGAGQTQISCDTGCVIVIPTTSSRLSWDTHCRAPSLAPPGMAPMHILVPACRRWHVGNACHP